MIKLTVHDAAIVAKCHLPHYWATVWSLLENRSVARSTHRTRLRHLDSLYSYTEHVHGPGALDDALAKLDFDVIEEILEGFFMFLKNQPDSRSSYRQSQWETATRFVRTIAKRLSVRIGRSSRADQIELRLVNLDRLYTQLRTGSRKQTAEILSLPACVVAELYDLLAPYPNEKNPFRNETTQWRMWVALHILLHQGLRRGEFLALPLDAIKTERTATKVISWIDVRTNPYEDDPRSSTPSIKTPYSIRQMPITSVSASVVQAYIDNYRSKAPHSFLVNSALNRPMSAEGLVKHLKKVTLHLSDDARRSLMERTGKAAITPHMFRHTCAVVRLNQLLEAGDPMPEALQKIRSFFGWSPTSDMPLRYAKAVFDQRLAKVWNDAFDHRVAILRSVD